MKTEVLARVLRSASRDATGLSMSFEQFMGQGANVPDIVINGLDNIDARHHVQRQTWSDVISTERLGTLPARSVGIRGTKMSPA
jgi:hypothetical protein